MKPARLLLSALMLAALAGSARAQQPPLRAAVDASFPPHSFPALGGGLQGFNIDLFTEVARRMGRGITIDSAPFSGLVPALLAGRYDFLAAPVTVTKDRAENLLFAEGYMWTAYQFGIRKGSAPIKGWEDLKGKVVAVNKGTPYESLARQKGSEIGLTVQAYDTNPDAVQAVLQGRAYADLAGNTVVQYAATKAPGFVADLELKDTRAQWAAPFRKDEAALRDQVEDAMDCMKQDGTLAKLSEKWFGATPGPDALQRIVQPGYGVPGMPGYDPKPQVLHCS